ncbi:hypothetical protein [Paenibacillus arenosi]|uniref:DUF1700 domain-containing protein n=1 Tax=Paenibacillus arenosi TaxID=2774142 RepID=A0ABR9B3T8_9BACL|nr:hypothetical protein [Paenibacillus arenosi]MBD8500092.1 hypothetical protein [Paenibacillus arenosi]
MKISQELEQKITKYVKQSTHLVDSDDLTYFEKIALVARLKMNSAKKAANKLKWTSKENKEAQEDLMNYMTDYIFDQITEGYSEEEAFERAKAAFSVENPDNPLLKSDSDWINHYEPHVVDAVNLYYAAYLFIGLALGAFLGLVLQILTQDQVIGVVLFIAAGIGSVGGLGAAMLKNAQITMHNHK